MISKPGYIYFMSNHYNNVLYIGVTNNLLRRIAEHKANIMRGFTYTYNCHKFVYYEIFDSISGAIAREKQLKSWKRTWKNELVNSINPMWQDLSDSIGINENLIDEVKAYYKENMNTLGHSGPDPEPRSRPKLRNGVADQVRHDERGE